MIELVHIVSTWLLIVGGVVGFFVGMAPQKKYEPHHLRRADAARRHTTSNRRETA